MEQEINISQNNNQEILINSNDPQVITLNNNEVQDILINQNENQNLNISQPENQLLFIDSGGNVIGITDVLVNGVTVVSGNIAYVTVPTKTSELQNNSGFITSETDPTVPSYIKQISLSDINSWNNKQDQLVSGSTIKTINNESLLGSGNINITGTQYSAGDGISIENDIISNTITSYSDLSDLPTIPTKTSDLINDSDFVSEDDLSEVAFTGSYGSLSDTPVIPDSTSDLINNSGFIDNTVNNLTNYTTTTDLNTLLGDKQDTLVSGTNIKTINNNSLLGSGNITISGGTPTDVQVNGTSITSNNVANLITNGTYNSSTNKIATMSDIPTATSQLTNTGADGTHPYIPALDSGLKGLGVTSGRLFWEYGPALTDTTLANYSDIPTKTSDLTNDGADGTHPFIANYDSLGDYGLKGLTSDGLNLQYIIGPGNTNITLQEKLVSGTNIKTINNNSLLGSGNITISGGTPTDVQVNGTSITSNNVANLITNGTYNSSTNKIATMSDISNKQDTLVSGTNIKTINNNSLLGSGNLQLNGIGCWYANGSITWSSAWSWEKIPIWGTIYDNANFILYGNGIYIPAGVSLIKITINCSLYNVDCGGDKNLAIYKNGVLNRSIAYVNYDTTNKYINMTGQTILNVAQSDEISVQLNSELAGTMRIFDSTTFTIEILG